MRCFSVGLSLLLAGVCLAADTPVPTAGSLCSNSAGSLPCEGSKKDLKTARQAFERGLQLEKSNNMDQALYEFEGASRLVPQNVEYLTARELTRQHLASVHLEKGNTALLAGKAVEALAEFRTALSLDPQNEFAQQRIGDAIGPVAMHTTGPPQLIASADEITAKPNAGRHDIHYRGDSRGLLTTIASSYGLTVIFDDSFPSRRVRLDIDDADFAVAMQAASAVTKSFSVALEDTVLLASADTLDNHKFFDRMGMRSFYIPTGGTPQELQELMNTLRALFEFKFLSLDAVASTIVLRGPQSAIEGATQFLSQLNTPRPEVMLDIKVFQVSHTYAKNIGLHVPNNFNLFNIPVSALAALGGQNLQDLINQLIASGGINQAGNQTIAALLAQLMGQSNSIFSQPLATFGGGLTLMGLSLDQLAGVLSMNESSVRSLEHVQLRASQQKDATFKLGSRYPIMNASFAPVFNSAAIAQVIGNQSFTAPFPSVNYEDIGLNLKAKPLIHSNSDVSIELELQFRSLGNTNTNGIPDILNREYKGGILVKEGEPAVVAGMLTQSDQRSLNGLPLFSTIPGFGLLTSQNSRQEEDDELLIMITPYVIRDATRAEAPEIWMGK
jgi:general secretion pathway protein D